MAQTATVVSDRLKSAPADEAIPFRQAPHNLEAEQALLGAILVNNEAMDKVSSFLEALHFFDPLHQQIFETAGKLMHAGKSVTPITLRTFFERAEPISPNLTVPQYLGTLAAKSVTIINAADYGRTIFDLATRRALIIIGEEAVTGAYDSPCDWTPVEQISAVAEHLKKLRETTCSAVSAVSLAAVEPKHVEWLWHRRIARGKLNLIAGQPGRGKSQLTIYIAGRITTGGSWPDGAPCPQGSVIFITCEDDAADTIVPRLMATGADVSRCYLHLMSDIGSGAPSLEEKIKAIGDVVAVVIDPVLAYLGKIDGNNAPEVRRLLAPLQQLAADTNVAVLLVTHPNKGAPNGDPMARVSGSGAFVAVARSAWLVEKDPQDEAGRRRILAPLKNNIGDDATAFAFRVESATVGNGIDTSHVVFEPGTLTTTAAELLLGQSQTDEERGAQGEAEEFLRDMLKDGPVNSKFVKDAAKKAEIAPRTLDRARARLKVRAIKSDITGCWLMALPGSCGSDQLRQERQGRQERHVLSDEEIGVLGQERQEHPPFGGGVLGGVGALEAAVAS